MINFRTLFPKIEKTSVLLYIIDIFLNLFALSFFNLFALSIIINLFSLSKTTFFDFWAAILLFHDFRDKSKGCLIFLEK